MDRWRRGSNCSEPRQHDSQCQRGDAFYCYNDEKADSCPPPFPRHSRVLYYKYKCQKPNPHGEEGRECCQHSSRNYYEQNSQPKYSKKSDQMYHRQPPNGYMDRGKPRYRSKPYNECDDRMMSMHPQEDLQSSSTMDAMINCLISHQNRGCEVTEFMEQVRQGIAPRMHARCNTNKYPSPEARHRMGTNFCRRCHREMCSCYRENIKPTNSADYYGVKERRDHRMPWYENCGRPRRKERPYERERPYNVNDRNSITIQRRTLEELYPEDLEHFRNCRQPYRTNHQVCTPRSTSEIDNCHYRYSRGLRNSHAGSVDLG